MRFGGFCNSEVKLLEVESSMHSARPVPRAMARLLKLGDLQVSGVPDLGSILLFVVEFIVVDRNNEPLMVVVLADGPSKPGGGGVRDVA